MKRQEILLNLTLLVIIAALIYFIYESREAPRDLEELPVTPASVELADAEDADGVTLAADPDATAGQDGAEDDGENGDGDTEADAKPAGADDAPPGTETGYAGRNRPGAPAPAPKAGAKAADGATTSGKEVADAAGANRGGQFGTKNLFRALLTPTPTPTPPPPTPAPTPDIGKALGAWRLLSVYEGKAMIEDVQKSAAGEEGAIFEIPPGGTKQVDVGGGVMKTVTLNAIDAENPYNPEVTFGMEDTKAEKKINLDTEPAAAAAKPEPNK